MKWKTRYNVMTIIFFSYLLCYMDRMVMASAIPFIAKDFSLTPFQMGAVMSAFFFSYALSQIPGGLLADKFGSRVVVAFGLAWWSIFTFCTGLAQSLKSMIAYRVLFGIGEGVFPPAAFKTIASWFPHREVGRASALTLSTNTIGPAIAPLLVSILVIHWGWRMVFYSLMFPGLIMVVFVWWYCKHPRDSQYLSKQELAEIEENVEKSSSTKSRFGFLQLIRIKLAWKCFFTHFFYSIAMWGLMSWLPTYYLRARGFSIMKTGVATSLIFVAATIGILLSGYVADRWFKDSRHLIVVFGTGIGAIFVYLSAIAISAEVALMYQGIAFFFLWFASASNFAIPIAVFPEEVAGLAMGFANTGAQTAGFCSPMIVGYMLTVTHGNYYYSFMLFVVCLLLSTLTAWSIGSTKKITLAATTTKAMVAIQE